MKGLSIASPPTRTAKAAASPSKTVTATAETRAQAARYYSRGITPATAAAPPSAQAAAKRRNAAFSQTKREPAFCRRTETATPASAVSQTCQAREKLFWRKATAPTAPKKGRQAVSLGAQATLKSPQTAGRASEKGLSGSFGASGLPP